LGPVLKQLYKTSESLDLIMDEAQKYKARLEFDKGFQVEQPVIGIATTPPFSQTMRTSTLDYDHFTWQTNVNYLHYAGSWTVPVRWDLNDEDLEELLDSINGIFFAGGGTPLVDKETGEQSFFYKFAKRVWAYMKK